MKEAIARGETGARSRFYVEILIFEFASAALAFAALGFDPARFDPSHLQLGETAFGRWCESGWQKIDASTWEGFLIGALCGTAAFIFLLWRLRHRGVSTQSSPAARSGRILPDFGALIPTTSRERLIFVLVAQARDFAKRRSFVPGFWTRSFSSA